MDFTWSVSLSLKCSGSKHDSHLTKCVRSIIFNSFFFSIYISVFLISFIAHFPFGFLFFDVVVVVVVVVVVIVVITVKFWFWFCNQQDSFTNMIVDGYQRITRLARAPLEIW